MKEFKLNKATVESIYAATGLSIDEIANTDVLAVDDSIQRHINKKLTPEVDLGGITPRGSVLLMFKRFFTPEEINKGIAAIRP